MLVTVIVGERGHQCDVASQGEHFKTPAPRGCNGSLLQIACEMAGQGRAAAISEEENFSAVYVGAPELFSDAIKFEIGKIGANTLVNLKIIACIRNACGYCGAANRPVETRLAFHPKSPLIHCHRIRGRTETPKSLRLTDALSNLG